MVRALIVDDSLIMRKEIRKVMESLGHTVVSEAKNAEEAVSMYGRFRVNLVTMDINMSGKDGISAAKDIIQLDPDANIVMITSQGQEDMVVDAIGVGAIGYILKPITSGDQISKVIDKIFKKSG